MALSYPANWLREARKDSVEPYFRVQLKSNVANGNKTFTFLDRPISAYNHPASVSRISPLSTQVDPLSRKGKVGRLSLAFAADGVFKAIWAANRLVGGQADIWWGFVGLSTSDEADYFRNGMIEKITPRADGSFDLDLTDMLSAARDWLMVGYWPGQHALDAIYNILHDKIGIPDSALDLPSLEPSESRYSDISHHVVIRGGSSGAYDETSVLENTSAMGLIDELCETLHGHLLATEDGKISFKRFDTAGAALDTWTDDDMLSLEAEDVEGNVLNEVTICSHSADALFDGTNGDVKTTRSDSTSQAAYAWPLMAGGRVYSHEIRTPWINGEASLFSSMTAGAPGVGGTFIVVLYRSMGMCGTYWPGFPAGAQPAHTQLSGTRTALLRIDGEIIEVDQVTLSTTAKQNTTYYDAQTGTNQYVTETQRLEFRVKTRGAYGTTAAAHDGGGGADRIVSDVTVPMFLADTILTRFRYWAPKLRIRTRLDKSYLQRGDIVQLSTARLSWYGHSSGIGATDYWEVTSKEVDPFSDTPGVQWVLTWSRQSSPPSTTKTLRTVRTGDWSFGRQASDAVAGNDMFVPASAAGFTATTPGGLQLTVANGTASFGLGKARVASVTVTLTASKDNYVYFDVLSRSLVIKETAAGAGEPTRELNLMPVCLAVTSGAAVTSITDLRNDTQYVTSARVTADVLQSAAAVKGASALNFNHFFQS